MIDRLGETYTTGYPSAHHSTVNRYLSGLGWMSYMFVCFCLFYFIEGLFVLLLLEFVRLYMQQLKKTMQQQTKTQKQENQKQTFDNQTKQPIQPEPERYLFTVEWWAGGCPVFCILCFY